MKRPEMICGKLMIYWLLELLYRYAPDEDILKKILVDNPAKLFGFPHL
jgi:hypothetical protein